jgi:tetratricopeptide (TPR) repeat protein
MIQNSIVKQSSRHSQFSILHSPFLLLPFAAVLATVFVLGRELANGIVSGKYFWFYGSMGLVGAVTLAATVFCRRAFRFSVTDVLVLLFTGSVYLSSLVFNRASGNTTGLTILALLTVLYFAIRLLLSVFDPEGRRQVREVFCLLLALTGLVEAAWGWMQLYGFAYSRHHLFKLTGSFFNPGPYAGYLAMMFPLALDMFLSSREAGREARERDRRPWPSRLLSAEAWHGVRKWIALLACVAILPILPAAMSRASWLAVLAGSAVVALFRSKGLIPRLKSLMTRPEGWLAGCAVALLVSAALAGMYFLKKDSADGRALMWKVSLHVAARHPPGVGTGHFPAAYGDAQAAWMAGGKASETEKQVAGNPEYGFNEYLQILVESGWGSFLLFLGLLVFTFRSLLKSGARGAGPAGSLTALLVFAFFSYPFSVLPFPIAFTFLLAMGKPFKDSKIQKFKDSKIPFIFNFQFSILHSFLPALAGFLIICGCLYRQYPVYQAYKSWARGRVYYHAGAYREAVRAYETLYPQLNDRIQYLFEYGRSLSEAGEPSRSNDVLRRATQISCDPMLYNVMGKNHQAMKEYPQAEACLTKSAQIVPNRLYPWYLLARLYEETGEREKARQTARIVLTKEPKVQSAAVREMREKMKGILRRNE